MDYSNVTNPVYGDASNKTIKCLVEFAGFPDPLPFTATAEDPEAHGGEIYAELVAGKYGAVGAYVAPAIPAEVQYSNALGLGLQVTSTSTKALNGNYSVQDSDIAAINAQAQYITLYGQFTAGATQPWPDTSLALHVFNDTATFMEFAKAAVKYSQACKTTLATLNSGSPATFPSNAAAID
jgi:hypothetical protein